MYEDITPISTESTACSKLSWNKIIGIERHKPSQRYDEPKNSQTSQGFYFLRNRIIGSNRGLAVNRLVVLIVFAVVAISLAL
jgi:hypothetical protein